MEQLLKQAQDLVNSLNQELNETRVKNAELNAMAAKLRIERKEFDDKVASIEKREQSVLTSEEAVEALKEAKRIRLETISLQAAINDSQAVLDKDKEEFLKNKAQVESELAEAKAHVERESADFKRLKVELAEKEKTLKDKILNEIKGRL